MLSIFCLRFGCGISEEGVEHFVARIIVQEQGEIIHRFGLEIFGIRSFEHFDGEPHKKMI